jgi:Tol biopolymer transport system component
MSGDLIGHYEVLERLAAGGMGVVYRAEDVNLRRVVALKLLPDELTDDPERRKRLVREARTAASLSHPNICTIYEVGEDRGRIFVAMELVPGTTLASRLASGPLPGPELLSIARDLAEGLAEAHARGVVHRDFKPQNVMITPAGRAKILDFGLAKLTSPLADDSPTSSILSREGLIVGTAPYMSPEQAQGAPLDATSDVFSFGTVAYQMATGRRPFQGETAAAVIAEILKADPEPLAVLRPNLPLALRRIIERCLRKRPQDRYANARELSSDLATVLEVPAARAHRRPGGLRWLLASLLLVGAIATYRLVQAPVRVVPPSHRQVTFNGHATIPAISPDGRFLAYVDKAENPQRVVVQETVGSGGLTVFEARDIYDLRWAPDGGELAVTSAEPSGTHLVPRLGGAARKIQEGYFRVAWAPDGASLALSFADRGGIAIVSKSGSPIREVPLRGGYDWVWGMEWSPTGSHILLCTFSGSGRAGLWLVSLTSGQETPLLETAEGKGITLPDAAWSRDGAAFYYLRADGATTDLWRGEVGSDGKLLDAPRALVTGLQAGRILSLAGDGALAYTRETERSTLSLAKRGPTPDQIETTPLTTGTQTDFNPSVSPDGGHVAFARMTGQDSSIVLMPLTAKAPRQLTFLEGLSFGPAWSPDGHEIAFVATESGAGSVWIVPATGGAARPVGGSAVTSVVGPFRPLTWAPGRRIVYHSSGHANLGILDPATKESRRLLAVPDEEAGWVFGPMYSPDAESIAVDWNREKAGIWLIQADSGKASVLAEASESSHLTPLGWSQSGRGIFVLETGAEPVEARVVLLSVPGGKRTPFMNLPFVPRGDSVMTADGRLIAVVAEKSSDVWLMENFDLTPRR